MTGPTSVALRSEAVHDRLRAQILDGRLQPGDALPSERVLSERLGVNRHAVREAVKRLQQAGLVHVAQGGATRVLDWHRTGGLELLADLGTAAGGPETLRAMAEMRATVGADAARLCASRASKGTLPFLARARQLREPGSFDERLGRYEELWAAIVDGSQNIAYRLAFNSLVFARHGHGVPPEVYRPEVDDPGAAEALATAIDAGDGDRAADLARALLERTLNEVSS